jgi:amidophosphoribosyltransferase
LLKPEGMTCKVEIVFQPLANLPKAIPNHRGDWYFSGNYPTPGGNRVVNQAFINYVEGRGDRAY